MIPDTGDGSTAFPRHSEPYEPLPPVPYDPALIAGMAQMRQLFEPVPLRPDNLVWSREHVDRLIPPDGDPLAMTPDAPVEVREIAITGVDGNEILLTVDQHGGEIVDGPNKVPTGRNLTVRHPGGATIEYVELNSAARAGLRLAG